MFVAAVSRGVPSQRQQRGCYARSLDLSSACCDSLGVPTHISSSVDTWGVSACFFVVCSNAQPLRLRAVTLGVHLHPQPVQLPAVHCRWPVSVCLATCILHVLFGANHRHVDSSRGPMAAPAWRCTGCLAAVVVVWLARTFLTVCCNWFAIGSQCQDCRV